MADQRSCLHLFSESKFQNLLGSEAPPGNRQDRPITAMSSVCRLCSLVVAMVVLVGSWMRRSNVYRKLRGGSMYKILGVQGLFSLSGSDGPVFCLFCYTRSSSLRFIARRRSVVLPTSLVELDSCRRRRVEGPSIHLWTFGYGATFVCMISVISAPHWHVAARKA